MLAPSLASADEPTLVAWAEHRVQEGILRPLSELEGHRFSRARPAPRERRVRVLQTTATRDAAGRPFVPFAVDVRFGADWHEGDIVGCAYTGTGNVYVKRGDEYRPASFLVGKNDGPVSGVCQAGS